ncbi:hypothetical protein DVV91_17215 [Clostridium botulinum]|uniref:hypothetical protein n=1 Tax=Clostridium botulinum TaxID=1491 RepID=UPI001967AA0D|nr:hypothetical protein [Clostridium botulinum]MBN1076062.1 hypothetical protein [Clostridium botulinum]
MRKSSQSSFKSIKGKSKVIKLRNGESIMDGNSVQTPFLAPYRITKNEDGKPEPLTLVEYTWTNIENGVEVQRGLKVSGHGELGVPTLKDKEVLRALQDIYIWSKIDKGVLKLETDESKITEEDLMIDFISIDNIATAMGYKRISGQQRQSIKESIERLVATTVFNRHSGGLYDPVKKRYITDSKISYKYLDSMENYVEYDCDNCLYLNGCHKNTKNCLNEENKKTDTTKIKMSLFLYLSIANNYRLYYNKDKANEIKNLIAKNIYLISRKWLGEGYISKANIQKYMDRLPMNAKQEKHKKQAIKEGITILNSYNFVEANIDKDVVTVIHLDKKPTELKNGNIDKLATKDTTNLKDKYCTFAELRQGLLDIGLTELEFSSIVDNNIEKIEYIKALLRYVMIKHMYDNTIIPRDYFVHCWYKEGGTPIDKKFFNEIV